MLALGCQYGSQQRRRLVNGGWLLGGTVEDGWGGVAAR